MTLTACPAHPRPQREGLAAALWKVAKACTRAVLPGARRHNFQ